MIVGAAMGGLRTAESLRRFGFTGGITLVGAESHLPYNRPPLSKDFLAKGKSLADIAFPIRHEELQAEFILGDPARSLDIDGSTLGLESGAKHNFDYLVAATGLRSKRFSFPNDLNQGRHVLRTYDDARSLRGAVAPERRVVIFGAGFIGLELAATLRTLGCTINIVAIEEIPLAGILGDTFGREIRRRHEREGVNFHLGLSIEDLIGTTRIEGVVLSDGTELHCDILIEAVGSIPNVDWLTGNGLDLSNGVLTDQTLRVMNELGTSSDRVFAVGDIARFPYVAQSLPARRVEHWNIPIESAKWVGRQICHQDKPGLIPDLQTGERFNPLPSFWSDQFSISILSYGEPKLANESPLVEGEISDEFIMSYRRDGELVGIAGIGMRRELNKLRGEIRL
ncbi:MAG: NAD(P)/FAD-dependent oxidoreductase [Actinomycetota bacterium]